jgi:phospholipid/cholesterol/gamma-HCH transport system substrate-binding protein
VNRRQVGARLAALAVVALVGVTYITFDVLGFRLDTQPFKVTVELPRGGGLYADGYVTYRGVDVGRIATLSLSPSGAVVTLAINSGTHIPADAIAHVHELSVAGEQYLDLVPSAAGGPDLHAGSVIGRRHTVVPVSVFQLLNDAGHLIGSVNASDVKAITDAFGTGFADTGSDLRSITVATGHLISALQAAQSATVTGIVDAGPILSTALASSGAIISFSQSLETITAQLAASDANVQRILTNGVPTELALQQIVQTDGVAITRLIQNFSMLSEVAIRQQPAIVSLLQQLPGFVRRIAETASNGSVAAQLYYNSQNTVCPYINGAQGAEPTAATGSPDLNRICNLKAPDLLQRGSAEAPVASGG